MIFGAILAHVAVLYKNAHYIFSKTEFSSSTGTGLEK